MNKTLIAALAALAATGCVQAPTTPTLAAIAPSRPLIITAASEAWNGMTLLRMRVSEGTATGPRSQYTDLTVTAANAQLQIPFISTSWTNSVKTVTGADGEADVALRGTGTAVVTITGPSSALTISVALF